MAEGQAESGAFDALVMAGRLAEAAAILQCSLPADSADFATELQRWQLDLADLERVPAISRREPWTRDQRRLRNRLLALRDAVQARLRVRADAAALLAGQRGAGALAAALADAPSQAPAAPAAPDSAPSVFISYSRKDLDAAQQVRRSLVRLGVRVRLDSDMPPGTAIQDFIQACLRETDCTLCILSGHSLLSDWVALETTLALSAGTWGVPRLLVGGFLDESFREPEFEVRAIEAIDRRIATLQQQVRDVMALGSDYSSLAAEGRRLNAMRAGLDTALGYFRAHLCVDLRPGRRAAGLRGLADTLATARAAVQGAR